MVILLSLLLLSFEIQFGEQLYDHNFAQLITFSYLFCLFSFFEIHWSLPIKFNKIV